MNCHKYDGCVNQGRETLTYPTEDKSLYADRIYDNQTTNKRCYEKEPIEIIEGFSKNRLNRIIRWIIIIIILYILVSMLIQFLYPEKVYTIVDISPISMPVPKFTGETINEFIPYI